MPEPWRPLRGPAVLGLLALVVLVVAYGRSALPTGMVLDDGLLGLRRPADRAGWGAGVAGALALAVLLASWWRVLVLARRGAPVAAVVATAALWWSAVLLADPLLSLDAYAYLAQGHMLAQGLDPSAGGPVLLGAHPSVQAVDPLWRGSPSPYGPVALLLLKAVAVLGVDPVGGVLVLRLVAVSGVVLAAAAANALVGPDRRADVLSLVALNPLTVVHLVGGAHLDALLAGLLAVSVLALTRRRTAVALLCAALAVGVKVVALPVLVLVVLAHVRSWRSALGAAAVTVLPFAVVASALPPLGFLQALSTPGRVVSWFAPATWAGAALERVGGLDGDTALLAGRAATLAAGCLLTGWLLLQVRRGRRSPVTLAAAVALTAAVTVPVVHAWYPAVAVPLLAMTGHRWALPALVGASSLWTFGVVLPVRGPLIVQLATWAALAVVLGVGAGLARRPSSVPPSNVPAPAPRVRHGLAAASTVLLPLVGVGLVSGPSAASAASPAPTSVSAVRLVQERLPSTRLVRAVPGPAGAVALDLVVGGSVCRTWLTAGLVLRPPPAGNDLSPCGPSVRAALEGRAGPAPAASPGPRLR